MNGYLWRNLILLLPSGAAMLYGLIYIFPKSKGLYFRMGALGMASLFAGFLYSLTSLVTDISTGGIVDLGVLGNIGLSLFLMTQNADNIASMLYRQGNGRGIRKYLSVLSPAVILVIWLAFEIKLNLQTEEQNFSYWFGTVLILGICALLNAITAYYTLHYSLAEDEKGGLVDCLRPFNRAMTALLVLLTPEYFIRNMTVETTVGAVAVIVYYLLLALCILAVLPLMERGRVKFLTSL